MLICPVRDCRRALARQERRLVCALGHSFDIARSGYVNLLQPQERRSKSPGDAADVVAARRRLHDRGATAALLRGIEGMVNLSTADIVLDAGCGDGFYLGNLAERFGFGAHGIDISIPAVEAAARRYPTCEWVVGNADRLIPYADNSFTCVMSITARMNVPEFHRVLRKDARLLIAVPAPDDLIELRGSGRDRVERTVDEFRDQFVLLEKCSVRTQADFDAEAVRDVLLSIYRPRAQEAVHAQRVTFSLDLLVFRPV